MDHLCYASAERHLTCCCICCSKACMKSQLPLHMLLKGVYTISAAYTQVHMLLKFYPLANLQWT